jgi:hypothetical protein
MTAAERNLRRAVEAYANAVQAAADGDRARLAVWLGAAEAAVRLADRWQDRAEVTP